jgi:dUTP pyrophosphatase
MNQSKDWKELQEQIAQIIQSTGVDYDPDYVKELEEMFDINLDELNSDFTENFDKKIVQFEKIHPDAVSPSYAYLSDSGFDLYSVEQIKIPAFGRALVPTGLKFSFGDGLEIQVRPKSGLALKMGLTVLNTPGTIDQGYTGEIQVIVFNTNNNAVVIEKGTKIAQAVLCPVVCGKYVKLKEVDSIEDKERGNNGFGSTGF